MKIDRVNPDNIPAGYGGLDMEAVWKFLFIFILIIAIIEGIFIIYLLYSQSKNNKTKNHIKDKQEE